MSIKSIYRARIMAGLFLAALFVTQASPVSAAACPAPTTSYGSATMTVSIPAAGSYKAWARLKTSASDTNANSFMLEIDGNTCIIVGDNTAISQSQWTWVDYRDGATSSKATHTFTAGSHSVKLIGREPGVRLDRVIFTADMGCVPSGVGDNCTPQTDTSPPSISLSSPASGASLSATVNMTATASDSQSGIQKVQFLVDGQVAGEDISAPYAFSWNTMGVSNGSHTLAARAHNGDGLIGASNTIAVTVNNTAPPPPPPPSTFRAEDINQDGKVNLLDFSLLAAKYGQTGAGLGRADVNQDGRVNLLDFSLVAAKYGT